MDIRESLNDVDGLRKGLRLYLWFVVIIEIPSVGSFKTPELYGERGRVGGALIHPEYGEIGVNLDVADSVLFIGQRSVFQLHRKFQCVVHEVAVDFIVHIVVCEIVITRVAHPFGDEFTLVLQSICVVDVAFFEGEFGAVAHD